ncbi:16685_t:CDS:10 [Funneliformis mosseae]|uniref:16685_t:CDS:1 n=1 Tax=Funneliformis mosseae TaxID=27381 RepID=A0A9N8ZY48_FUNMO|nr:16685_t:CDS:10 [Funneliformis mosseae]
MSVNYQSANNQLSLLYQQAVHIAENAVKDDQNGNVEAAIKSYSDVTKIFESILQFETNQIKKNKIIEKYQEYNRRITELKSIVLPELSIFGQLLKQAQSKSDQALLQDKQRNNQMALELYTESLELFMKAMKETKDDSIRAKLTERMNQIFERAEDLKGLPTNSLSLLSLKSANPNAENSSLSSSNFGLSSMEIEVLEKNSQINNKIFPPWPEEINEQFEYDKPFIDDDGLLNLSIIQRANFGSWKRPSQIMEEPKMITMISSAAIKQDIVTDCSFVASLCVSAAYQKRFGNKQRKIYDKVNLQWNSKKIVDDLLPLSRDGTLMCTFSTNKDELWPSIIEKAYLKLMGGYDFPGSNSGIDLYALTGWIPEHIFIDDKDFEKETTWKRLLDGQRYGDALVTIATGYLSDAEADSLGLVPIHAYAVLDIREANGFCLLQVKNPWSHKRWMGPFSHLDNVNWTPELIKTLDYDRENALNADDGIFWIDYDSVCQNFFSIHMNWNPELFPYTAIKHSTWPANVKLQKDILNLGYYPQFCLEVTNDSEHPSPVRLLLTKHITVTEENKDYITLHIYNDTNGEKIYYPRTPWKQGAYVNSPHILVRFNAPTGVSRYTIVVAQIEKAKSLDFTLKCYCMSKVILSEVPKNYPNISGQWTSQTAGGNASNKTYLNNPEFRVSIMPPTSSDKARLLLMLEGPREHAIDVRMVWSNGKRIASLVPKDILMKSTGYRNGFCYCEKDDVKPGDYTIVVSTYEPGLIGDFILTVASDVTFNVTPIPLEGAGMFKEGVNAVGCHRHNDYYLNPSYHLKISEMIIVKIRLQTPEISPTPMIHIKIFEKLSNNSLGKEVANSGHYASFVQGVCTDDIALPSSDQGYVIVFSTWEKNVSGKFVAYIYSDRNVIVEEIVRE